MNQREKTNKTLMSALAILMIVTFGLAGQVDAKSRKRNIHVEDISISLISGSGDSLKAQVELIITDDQGVSVPDVMVIGKWIGLIKGRQARVTDADGKAVFISDSTDQEGIIKFKVKNAGTAGCRFIQGKNNIKIRIEDQANLAPIASVACSSQCGPAPFNVTLCGKKSVDPDGKIVDFDWEYGDGNKGKGVMNQHLYTEPGTYFAKLTVKDDDGQAATDEMMIIITGAPE